MSIAIETKLEKEYLELKFKGDFSLAEAKKAYKYTIDTAVEHQKSKVLIDALEVSGTMTIMERFEIAEFLTLYCQKNALGKIARIALVGKEPLVDRHRFGEIVAVNRGLNVKVFTDWTEALMWIKE